MVRPTILTALLAVFAPATRAPAQMSSPPATGARGTQQALGAIGGGAVGGLLGAVVGSAVRHTRWVPVRGAPGGLGLGIKTGW